MFNKTILAVAFSLAAWSAHAQEHPSTFIPAGGYASTTGAQYIEPSISKAIQPTQKISKLTERNFAGDTVVQKLSEHTYWAQTGFYNVVFYVGKDGVLLIDALSDGSGAAILKAIASVTDKPVTTLVYSHGHADHIGDAPLFVESAKAAGRTLRIVSTDKTAEKLAYLKSTLPKPTETVAFNNGEFKFEDLTVRAMGFEHPAHTDDSAAWLLVQEKVIHAPDIANPDQMPYLAFGGSENYTYLPGNLQYIANADWTVFSGGHGNVGARADIAFMQSYTQDLEAATGNALAKVDAGQYFKPEFNNHQASAHAWHEAVIEHAMKLLRPKFGHYYGFEASVPNQLDLVLETLTSYK
ncbi:hypothetical protein DTO96_101744 [Ephemeroptericola cinctiostellae]|uniref:Metallo-beta-lactamase domain-containing protein n=1 Tax=Ephemeroptericola cinctiostellae TaxID=2268024 RepID=A0A345DCB6_9BURK|nr:MBL fold metallo-hydrolase [Ephemeroptericola cinctiostellae]AXF86004.1 hypothetical protein DTO96_101744 [Ephemeroptericola cinctiostellae]